jgi:hypothetical protein
MARGLKFLDFGRRIDVFAIEQAWKRLRNWKAERLSTKKGIYPQESRSGADARGARRERTQGHEFRRIVAPARLSRESIA